MKRIFENEIVWGLGSFLGFIPKIRNNSNNGYIPEPEEKNLKIDITRNVAHNNKNPDSLYRIEIEVWF